MELPDSITRPKEGEAKDGSVTESVKTLEKSSNERDLQNSQEPPTPPPKDEKYIEYTQLPDTQKEASKADEGSINTSIKDEKSIFNPGLEIPTETIKHAFTRKNSDVEIQNIMEQFNEGKCGLDMEDVMTQRAAVTSPVLLPPRTSSLEARGKETSSPLSSPIKEKSHPTSPISQNLPSIPSTIQSQLPHRSSVPRNELSTSRPVSLVQHPPLPEPEPEPELPFDFHRFLEQLRHRTADPVAKFLRSFLNEFGKKQWMVHEQVKIISDFLEFISKKMAQCEVWRTVSDVEFDNAKEGMEKLVMNRLYSQTFSPVIPTETIGSTTQSKGSQSDTRPGRRGQHQEDVERDDVLAQKMRIYAWVSENHLDIKPLGDKGRKFLGLAQQGMLHRSIYCIRYGS